DSQLSLLPTHRSFEARFARTSGRRETPGVRHRPHSLVGPGKAVPVFLPSEEGMERREAPRGLTRPSFGPPQNQGAVRAPWFRRAHSVTRSAAPPGAPFGLARAVCASLTATAGCLPRAPLRRRPLPLETKKGPKADCGYIFLYGIVVKSASRLI